VSVKLFDVSHWNAAADFTVAKAAGYAGVYLKATDGPTYVDPTFTARAKAARAAGLHVGAYLFFHPDLSIGDQVSHFRGVVGGLCDLRPALDHETAPAGMSSTAIAAAAVRAAVGLQTQFGVAPIVYCDRAFIAEGKTAGLERFGLWIADYSGGAVPKVDGPWVMWQTGQANVPGVSGGDGPATDVNVAPSIDPLLMHPPTPKPVDSPLLEVGDVGPKVTDVQHALDLCDPANLTAHTDGMGHFGSRTQEILKTFQRNRHLKVTGTTTVETWAALRAVAHHTAR
jgi:GH25 family lysozyme M1 (1,4-beta-N-acetylmuramidase)